MAKLATFIIAVYNDTPTLLDTIESIYSTVSKEIIDIIVVDDAGTLNNDDLSQYPDVKLYKNNQRHGVGYSLDYGVKMANTEIVFPMGCDIRFSGKWFDRFCDVVKGNPKSIVSTVCAGLAPDRLYITGKETLRYASKILYHVSVANNGKPPLPFREYLEAKWNPKIEGDVEEIGCILGAFYGCHKSWYENIEGFRGHMTWGTLEPLISLRSYINGGNCLLDTKTITGHIFKNSSSEKLIRHLIYNKLLTAYTLLPVDMEKEVYEWARPLMTGDESSGEIAIQMAENNKALFDDLRQLKNSLSDEELRRRIAKTNVLAVDN